MSLLRRVPEFRRRMVGMAAATRTSPQQAAAAVVVVVAVVVGVAAAAAAVGWCTWEAGRRKRYLLPTARPMLEEEGLITSL